MIELERKVLAKIKPSSREREKEKKKIQELIEKIKGLEGKHAGVVLAGSLSRDTHLKGDNDIDLFLLFEKKLSREEFEQEGLRIGKAIFRGHTWEKAYSQHPYIRGNIEGFDVEIVPSYKISTTKELSSAVDRTPFHTAYLRKRQKPRQKDEVRLLKQFLKGIKCYGADLKVSSFSGYLVELMVLRYGSFRRALAAAANWQLNEVIDLERFYSKEVARKKFPKSPLVIIDPTDKTRNAAAALSFNQMARFMAAARAYLEKPNRKFFFSQKTKPWKKEKVKALLEKKELIGVEIGYPKKFIPDVMWGQLRRLTKKIAQQLEADEFRIYRSADWTDEKNTMVILVELENILIQKVHKVFGPEVSFRQHCQKFLEAHKKIVAGPRIEEGRVVVETERKCWDARACIKGMLAKAKKDMKAGMKTALKKKAKVLSEKELLELYAKNKEFQAFLTEYLEGKEIFY